MGLLIGTRLGLHEIVALLGKGGMGEVYRARDTKLKREVAIKILPDEFSSDPVRVSRFQREAEVLAALNHPNIAVLYDLQQAGDTRFLVLELVEGETLAERIQRGPVPVEEALDIARQICEALEGAHEKGIVHRDLKPANVKVTPDGKVKVLDFGLAKALESAPAHPNLSNSPTLSMAATNAGVILGTAAYMSPEQAKGAEADLRSDVFSFGCVLYEILTGRPAFQGESVSEILAAVLIGNTDLGMLQPSLNPRIVDLLRRCLEKNPKRRWQAVGDLRAELEIIAKAPRAVSATPAAEIQPIRPWWRRAVPAVLATTIVSTLVGIAVWELKPSPPASIARFAVTLPDGQLFTRIRSQVVALSPDGKHIVYVAGRQLYLRRLGDLESRPIPGTQQDVGSPFFSPDSQWVGFYSFSDSAIKKIPLSGGAAVTLCAACTGTLGYGVSWEGETIVFVRNAEEILAIPETGGKLETWFKAESDQAISSPQLLPGGDALMFSTTKADAKDRWDKANIVVLSRKTGERKVIVQGGNAARYVPTGHIIYGLAANLYAIPFDVKRLTATGGQVPIVENVMRSIGDETVAYPANFDFSKDGTLIYVPRSSALVAEGRRLVAIADRTGKTNAVPGLAPGSFQRPRLSPDGKKAAFETNDGAISIYDISGKSQLRRLTFESINSGPVWSPDGRRIAYRSNLGGKPGILIQHADGTGTPERLTAGQDAPFTWSPDGNNLVFARDNRLWAIGLMDDRKIVPLTEAGAYNGVFSPDGKWLAYISTQPTSINHVYVQQFPKGSKYQVSREPSNAPAWSRDGSELFYYQTDAAKFVAVRIQTQPSFSVSEPAEIPIARMIQAPGSLREYDILPDGKFLVVLPAPQPGETETRSTQQINVVLNWFEDLKQRVRVH